MKKITLLLIITLLLTGCASKASEDIKTELDSLLANTDIKYNVRENTSTDFFNYYLPSDMYDEGGDYTSAVVTYNDSKIVINLNIAAVVNNVSFGVNSFNNDGFFKEDMLFYEKSGTFIKNNDVTSKFELKVYKDSSNYLINLITDELNFYCLTNSFDLTETVRHMLVIAKSVEIDHELVNHTYSNKDVIEYIKQPVNLFKYDIPVTGFLSDLVHQSNGVVSNEETDITAQEEVTEDTGEEQEEIEQED